MASPTPAETVKVFAAILFREEEALAEALGKLRERLGEIDFEGPDHDFTATDYYEREMGKGLKRRIVSFLALRPPEELADLKLITNEVEDSARGPAGRRVNIDVGYLDVHKVVLASGKPAAQKISIGKGVWADPVLRYSKGAFHSFDWTFEDWKGGTYDRELLAVRERYKRSGRSPCRRSKRRSAI